MSIHQPLDGVDTTGWLTRYEKGSAVTVEFPAHPTRSAPEVRAPHGIVAAFRGQFVAGS